MMRKFWVIFGFCAAFWAASPQADEEYDPAVYPELAENEARANEGLPPLQAPVPASMAQTSLSPTRNGSVIDAPRFVEEADMNFDDVGNALGEEESGSAAPADIPMLQKSPVLLNQPTAAAPDAASPSAAGETGEIKVDAAQPLTENLKESGSGDGKLPLPKVSGTWINKLAATAEGKTAAPQTSAATAASSPETDLETMVEKAKRRNQRSNASVFDISGAMLRMSFQQIDDTLTRRGFRRSMQKMDIPNFIRWRNEDKCRAAGVVGYERLENCVIKIAKRDKHQYVETASYAKYDTKESIEVRFTSNFTNNKAYKISYKSEAANITGNSQKAIYLRNIKIYDFWKKINQTYGNPDNRDDVIWGLGGNKPYLQAATGRLVLEDPMLRELDYTRMSREDQRFMNTDLYSF